MRHDARYCTGRCDSTTCACRCHRSPFYRVFFPPPALMVVVWFAGACLFWFDGHTFKDGALFCFSVFACINNLDRWAGAES